MPDQPNDVIPLSRWRASLARARRGHRADALISEPDSARLVPKLPVQDLYYAIQEVGLASAHELLALASPTQLRGFVDLDTWKRDHLDEERLRPWLDALTDLGPEKLAEAVEAIDAEVLALYLQRQAHVYDLTLEEEPPDEPEGHYFPTPDRFFMLDIVAEGERGKSLEHMIDWLYRADLELARRVIMSARWELPSDLEEWAYRWRTGRMSDLGYADHYEALAIYRFLDPAAVKLGEDTAPPLRSMEGAILPAQLAGALDESSFFARALGTLASDEEIERVQGELLLLVNKAMAADLAEPGDLDAATVTLARTAGYLGLGLEYLSRGLPEAAGKALGSIALERLFRVGFSLTLQLKRLAETLVQKGQVLAAAAGEKSHLLLDAPYDTMVTALRAPRPELGLDGEPRPFRTLADVARAAAALDEAAKLSALFRALGFDPAAVADAIAPDAARFATLARTAAAHLLAGRPFAFTPLAPRELGALRSSRPTDDAARDALKNALAEKNLESTPLLERWLHGWFEGYAAALERPDGILIRLV